MTRPTHYPLTVDGRELSETQKQAFDSFLAAESKAAASAAELLSTYRGLKAGASDEDIDAMLTDEQRALFALAKELERKPPKLTLVKK